MTADGVPVPRDRVTVGPDGAMVVTFAKPVSEFRFTAADLADIRCGDNLVRMARGDDPVPKDVPYHGMYAVCPDSCEEDE